eukprot:sb/3473695/
MKCSAPEWQTEDEQLGRLLAAVNRLAQIDRGEKGGRWRENIISLVVDPGKFGSLFHCEIDFKIVAIPIYFSQEEIEKDCHGVLGIDVEKTPGSSTYRMKCSAPEWQTEDEQLGRLLAAVNRLAQIDRSLYYSPRTEGDTIFTLNMTD